MLNQTPEINSPANSHAPVPVNRIPDRDVLLQFVDAMFRNARQDGWVSFRVFADNGKSERPVLIQSVRLDDREFAELMLIAVETAANWNYGPAVFAPPLALFKSHANAKTENLREGVSISAECDSAPGAARSKLEALLGPATVVVESGGEWMNPSSGEIEPKVHLHWRLKAPAVTMEELAMLYEARSLAATLVGADRSNISIVHPIRWPGSWHCKKTPRLARIAALNADTEIALEDALDILRSAVGVTEPVRSTNGSGQRTASDYSLIASALAEIPNDVTLRDEKGNLVHDWHYWNTTGMTIWASSNGGSEEGRLAWHEWSAKAVGKYDYDETEKRWQHYFKSPPTRLGFGSLVYRARQANPEWRYEHPMDAGLTEAVGALIARLLVEKDEPDDDAPRTATAAAGAFVTEPVDLWGRFDPPPLPASLLPQVIEDFAADRAATLGADPSGFAVTALAVCAGAISDEIRLQPKRNDTEWLESARLWVLNIGDPSTMKTPVITAVTKPLRRIDHKLAEAYTAAYARWRQRPKEQQGEPPPPKLRAMIFDTTIESTQEILRDSPGGVLLEDDELSGWFDAMYKYSSGARGAQKDRSFWLQAYNGGPKTVDRITRGMIHIPNLSVSIAGASQPGPIRKLANAGEDDGLLQRFNPVMLRPAGGGRDEPPGQAVTDFDELINRLRALRSAVVLKFDDGALKIREELERKHLELMQIEWLNRKLTSHFGKYNGMFARLCLIWHCVEYVHNGPLLGQLPPVITENTARRVADFMHDFLVKHALAFYTSVLGLSNDHDRLSNIADYILAHELTAVTNRDVQRGDQTMRKLTRPETTAIFEQLEALGWVDIVPSPRRGYPPHWVVNPLVHQRFAEWAKTSKERREKGREIAKAISAGIRSKTAKED